MSLIQYELFDEDNIGEGLSVYVDIGEDTDNQMLLDEILESKWKYIVDMNVYATDGDYSILGYARRHFTDDQYFILENYMTKGIGETMRWLL